MLSLLGYIDYLPAPENLVVQMNNSCNLLLRHVQNAVNETLLHLEDTDVEKSSHLYKEVLIYVSMYNKCHMSGIAGCVSETTFL